MDTKERENFIKNAVLIVENTKDGFSDLIELNVKQGGYGSFEIFINAKQHDIYHMCYNRSKCCQCPPGYTLPKSRILHPSQLKLLFDKSSPKMCHNPARTADFCCCSPHRGLATSVLDVTLARCILINFCQDVFWYSCLTAQNQTLEDFLTHNKHDIYHLYDNNRCCQCPLGYVVPTQRPVLTRAQWKQMFSVLCLPCLQDRNRTAGSAQSICSSSVTAGITVGQLDTNVSTMLMERFCALKQSIEQLIELRNLVFGHVKYAQISDSDYFAYKSKIEPNLLLIAKICNKESCVKQKISDLDKQSMNSTNLQTIKAIMLAQMTEESSKMKDEITTLITQKTTEVKARLEQETREIKLRMVQDTADIKDEVTSRIEHKGDDIKDDIMARIEHESVKIKDEVTGKVERESTQITAKLTTRIEQESVQFKDEIIKKTTQHIDKKIEDVSEALSSQFDKKIEDVSEALSSQFGQDQARRQIEEKRKKLIENTKESIQGHTKENTFVHTSAVTEAVARIMQYGILILIGPPGSGKSRIGIELLRQFSIGNEKCLPLQLDDISQWQDMCNKTDVVLIDDVFGRTNCSYSDDDHSKLLQTIFTTVQNKKVKVILTLRNNIYQIISTNTESQRTFRVEHVLDLNKHQMTLEEKESCLMNYFAKNKIVLTSDIRKENINDDSILDTAITVYLHTDTILKILYADIGTHIGFPETCYLFASHWKFTRQGHTFFCRPTAHLKKEIDQLRQEGCTKPESMIDFTLLVYILLNGDSVNTDDVDQEAFISIMKTMYLDPLSNIPPSYINDSANRFNGKYLTINNEGNYCFQHRLISEAVMLSYSSADPKRVIPLLRLDFITEMTRPQNYKPSEGEVIITVPKSCYNLLAHRLLQLLDVEYGKERYMFRSYPYSFVQNLCKSKIITMTGNTILQEMITQYKYNEYNNHNMEFIRDHRFSGQNPHYVLDTYFFLPAALLMFCNTDNDPLYQLFYDRIHNTLTSESGHGGMEAFKESLMTALNFAVCTFDVKKSTVILKILTDHNIKQDYLPCDNILECQGLPGVQLLLDLHGLSHVFNITKLLSEIFMSFNIQSITIDDKMKQFITSVIVTNKHDKLPVRDLVEYVCRCGQLDFVKAVCERFDSSLFDVTLDNMIIEACRGSNTNVIQWLMEKYDRLYNVQYVLDTACFGGYTEGVKVILDRSDYSLLDMKSAMNEACSSYIDKTEHVKWLCERFDNNLFDMKTGMNKACRSGKTELVKWLCENFDNKLFDMKTGMNKACSSGKTELVKWLCEKFDNNLFDMKTGMNKACRSGVTELVKWLCENVDNNLFEMKTGMNKACSSVNIFSDELVKWLCEKFDNNLFDMKTGMNEACRSGNTKLVKWLCEKFDNNLFDMKTGMNEACSSGDIELVKWFCEKFKNMFDMKSVIMYTYNHYDSTRLEIHIDYIIRGYKPYDKEVIDWLFDNFDPDLFDIDSVDYTDSRYYHIDHIQFIYYRQKYQKLDDWGM